MVLPEKIKTKNPFKDIESEEYQAWQAGYESEDNSNPYEGDTLVKIWEQGKDAYLMDIKDIPKGMYCYSHLTPPSPNAEGKLSFNCKVCPYWYKTDGPNQSNGGCSFMGVEDSDENSGGLLWDQCKECGINDDLDEEEQ